ncbi:CAP domain-containing protein [Symbioplanes lichenis]|uniref:CAP domain-containing protein n=1 Tax=Symbioplanes lichenis TaxID=1629072 RepID=UPI00273A2798|nr:CAP domain-containing protein [Actinoplanes lichenis]
MSEMLRRIAVAAAASAALITATPASAQAVGPMTAPALMDDILTHTNEQRRLYGCPELTVEPELMVASVRQAHYMAATGDFGHLGWRGSTFEVRSRAAGYAEPAGENIAWGFADADAVVDAWMASPPHRRNILNCGARSFGAGVQQAANGTHYWAQVFGY